MLSPTRLQASFHNLLIIECVYRLPFWRLEGLVNKKGDIYCDGRLYKSNNIGLNNEWQGIMCSTPVLVRLTSCRAEMVRRMMKASPSLSELLELVVLQPDASENNLITVRKLLNNAGLVNVPVLASRDDRKITK